MGDNLSILMRDNLSISDWVDATSKRRTRAGKAGEG